MGKSKHSVNSMSQSTLLHKGMTKRKVAAHLGYVVRLVLICKVGFAIIWAIPAETAGNGKDNV